MMTPDEFNEYCARHRIEGETRTFIERVRTGVPARRVKSSVKNVPNRFASRKMGFVVQAESQDPEFAYVVLLEHDQDVLEFYDQPETLYVKARDKRGRKIVKRYTPDFLVLSVSKGPMLIECKPDEFVVKCLEKSDPNWWISPQGEVNYEPGRSWAEANRLAFRVVRSSELPAKRVQNLLMLADYFMPDAVVVGEEMRTRILAVLESPPWASRRQIMDVDPVIEADALNWMIAQGELYVDMDSNVLADDVRTLIFRDKTAADSFVALQQCRSDADVLALRAITLESGAAIVWDGVRHAVLQVGETQVCLQSSGNAVRNVPLVEFDQMMAQGLITADVTAQTTTSLAALERLRTASPNDLDVARQRLARLHAGAEDPPVATRTREWLQQLFRKGEKLYGNGFLGLIPRISRRGNRTRKLSEAVLSVMHEIVKEFILVVSPSTVTSCYGEARTRCKERALRPPSERIFRLHVKRIRKELIAGVTMGHKAAHQFEPWHVRLTYKTPRHGQRPFEIGHIDHTELDVFFVDEAFRKRRLRAWLTVLLDAYSRKVLSWFITFDKPSYRSVMCVIRECLRRHGRGCDIYVVDQGAEFNSTYFEVLLARLMSHKRERPAGKPRFGNLIERFFGVATEALLKQLEGSSQFLKNPRLLAKGHDPRQRAVWTLGEFEQAWGEWVENCYHKGVHETLGVSPSVAFEEGLRRYGDRAHRRFAFDDALRMLCLPAVSTEDEKLKINAQRGSVKVHGIHYHGAVLRDGKLDGHSVFARFDPFDVTRLYVYVGGGWQELRCAFAGDLEGMTLADLRIISEEMRAKGKGGHRRREHNLELLALHVRSIRRKQEVLKVSAALPRPSRDAVPPATHSTPYCNTTSFDVDAHWADVGSRPTGEF